MDTSQYLEIFIDETKEHLQNLNEQLLVLEKEPEDTETINEIFRAAHSLKGMSGTMGFKRMQKLTHNMENVFQEIRNENMVVKTKLVDLLFRGLDALENYLKNIQETSEEGAENYDDIIQGLKEFLEEGFGNTIPVKEEKVPVSEDKATENADKSKSKGLVLADYEREALDQELEKGKNVYGVTVYLNETCILKSARAFLVFKSIEDMGELLKSLPTVDEIEEEKFDFDFSWIFITAESKETIKAKIENVSEIKEVLIEDFIEPRLEDKEVKEEEIIVGQTTKEQKDNNSVLTAETSVHDGHPVKPVKADKTSKAVTNRSVRVDIDKLDVLMNLVSELIIAKNGLVSISSGETKAVKEESSFNEQIEYLERVTTNLHESVMKVRMVPIESVVNRFPRMIRDLSKKLNKKMILTMTGEETELDRSVIDEIGDPLMHLLRNAADHGLEDNKVRIASGKPEVGSIFLEAYQDGNNVIIEVGDDGGGIDISKVKKKALKKGAITKEQAEVMTDKEVIELLFQPSFSTADIVSDISGRGVGLDVVKTKIEKLGGSIEAKSEMGAGSVFMIRLPLTLAIIQALMVEVGREKYAIPLSNIQTIEDIPYEDVKFIQTKEVIHLRGNVFPLIHLDQLLDVEPLEEKPESLTVVILQKGDKHAGIVIDQLIGQQEIVIKSMGQFINNNKMIGGATILGDGEVALILEVNALV